MSNKGHGCQSGQRKVKGGGPRGATIGLLKYLSQSNNSADLVKESERFRFLDDLSILGIINLLISGLSSYPNHFGVHKQFIAPESEWIKNQTIRINGKHD